MHMWKKITQSVDQDFICKYIQFKQDLLELPKNERLSCGYKTVGTSLIYSVMSLLSLLYI